MATNDPPVNLRDAFFMVMISGQIESAEVIITHRRLYIMRRKCDSNPHAFSPAVQFPDFDHLYCTYSYSYGQDWTIVSVSVYQY